MERKRRNKMELKMAKAGGKIKDWGCKIGKCTMDDRFLQEWFVIFPKFILTLPRHLPALAALRMAASENKWKHGWKIPRAQQSAQRGKPLKDTFDLKTLRMKFKAKIATAMAVALAFASQTAHAQNVGVKANALSFAHTALGMGAEMSLGYH